MPWQELCYGFALEHVFDARNYKKVSQDFTRYIKTLHIYSIPYFAISGTMSSLLLHPIKENAIIDTWMYAIIIQSSKRSHSASLCLLRWVVYSPLEACVIIAYIEYYQLMINTYWALFIAKPLTTNSNLQVRMLTSIMHQDLHCSIHKLFVDWEVQHKI